MKHEICAHTRCDWRSQLHWYDTIDSTNTQAKRLAKDGAPHGTVLIADSQSAGRGRMGRQFDSQKGAGIYLSVILRPQCSPEKLMHLTCAAGVAMCDAVENVTGIRPGIKWINDLVYGTRKLGGILTELSIDTATGLTEYAIIGIGINCNRTAADFPPELQNIATSLSVVTKVSLDRAALAGAMIDALFAMDQILLTGKAAIMKRYRVDCITLGKAVAVHRSDEILQGTAIGLDEDGGLVVQLTSGNTVTVSAGEVSVRGLYGYI